MQDAGRRLRDRRLRPRGAGALFRPGPPGPVRQDAGRRGAGAGGGDPLSALGRQGRRRARRPLVHPGPVAAGERSGGGDRAARRALFDGRCRARSQVSGSFPGAGGQDGGVGLRGAAARRADGAPQPVRRHDLPARARSQERPWRHARSLRRALGGDGPLRDVGCQGAAGQGGDDRAPGAGVRQRDRVAAARPDRHARGRGPPAGSPALRAAGGDRAAALPGRARHAAGSSARRSTRRSRR